MRRKLVVYLSHILKFFVAPCENCSNHQLQPSASQNDLLNVRRVLWNNCWYSQDFRPHKSDPAQFGVNVGQTSWVIFLLDFRYLIFLEWQLNLRQHWDPWQFLSPNRSTVWCLCYSFLLRNARRRNFCLQLRCAQKFENISSSNGLSLYIEPCAYRNSEQTPDRTYICCCKFMYINTSDMIIAAATALGLMSHFFHHFCQRMLMCFFTLLLVCVCVCVCVCGRAGAIKVRPSTIGRHKPPRTSLTGSSSHSSSSSSSSSLRPWMSLSRDEQINGLSQYSTLSPSLLPRLPVCVSILRSLSLAFNSFTNC